MKNEVFLFRFRFINILLYYSMFTKKLLFNASISRYHKSQSSTAIAVYLIFLSPSTSNSPIQSFGLSVINSVSSFFNGILFLVTKNFNSLLVSILLFFTFFRYYTSSTTHFSSYYSIHKVILLLLFTYNCASLDLFVY